MIRQPVYEAVEPLGRTAMLSPESVGTPMPNLRSRPFEKQYNKDLVIEAMLPKSEPKNDIVKDTQTSPNAISSNESPHTALIV